jgi:hypothetical protein
MEQPMDVHSTGTPVRLNDLKNGECFSFEAGDQTLIGVKIG